MNSCFSLFLFAFMASCENLKFGGCNSFVDDPWPCCGGLYVTYEDAFLDAKMCEEMGVVSQGWLI